MAKNTNELQQRIRLTKKYANVDDWYGVWTSLSNANVNIPLDIRTPGMTIGILIATDTVEEYWYNGGITDQHLVRKNPSSDKNYVHNQNTVSAQWVISHSLNKFPSVTVIDTANNTVIGDVKYTDESNLTITFNAAFSGKAFLN